MDFAQAFFKVVSYPTFFVEVLGKYEHDIVERVVLTCEKVELSL